MTIPLIERVNQCRLCEQNFEHNPRPVLQINPKAKILIAGQAPGRKVHETGIPFNDPSGKRLRSWLGVSEAQFYNEELFAILPMAFCFPGTGKSGDLPPPPLCAATWREALLATMPNIEITLVIGSYAQQYHLPKQHKNLTETVRAWRDYWPRVLPLPHPSPRNNRWFKANPWFDADAVPALKTQVNAILEGRSSLS